MEDCKINMQLLPMKGHYFLWYAGIAPAFPFMSAYAKQLGFPAFSVGVIYTVLPLSQLLLNPVIGGIADRYKIQKKIFLIVQVITAIGYFSLIFLPRLPTENKIKFTCNSSGSAINIQDAPPCSDRFFSKISTDTVMCKVRCPLMSPEISFDAHLSVSMAQLESGILRLPVTGMSINGTNIKPRKDIDVECDVACDTLLLNEMISQPKILGTDIYTNYQLWLLLFVYIISGAGNALTLFFADTICLQLLGEKRYKFGSQRTFASFGWGIFAFVAGYIIDFYSRGEVQKNYAPSFGLACGILLVSALVSSRIQYTQQPHKANILRDVTQQLLTPQIIVYILWCMLVGVCCGILWGFQFWLLEDLADRQGCDAVSKIKTIQGLSMTLDSFLGELPFYLCSSWIFKRITYTNSMTLVLFLFGTGLILHSCVSNPWWDLPVSILNGAANGLFVVTMSSYASVVSPRGAEATTQGMVTTSMQAGNSMGSFLGGLLIGNVGSSLMFRIFGIVSLIACVAHAFAHYLIERVSYRRKEQSNQSAFIDDAASV